jgi:hypothetical protein
MVAHKVVRGRSDNGDKNDDNDPYENAAAAPGFDF